MITVNSFAGAMPLVPVERLPESYASAADNLIIKTGELMPLYDDVEISAVLVSGIVNSLYWYERGHWFSFSNDVDVAPSPIAQDNFGRVYITGNGKPKVTSNDIALGPSALPGADYELGVPAPKEKLVIASVTANDPDPNNIDDDISRVYVMTFVNGYGEEGAASPVSDEVTLTQDDDKVTLTVPVPTENRHNLVSKRIYRSVSTINSVGFRLVATIGLSLGSFIDDVADSALGGALETDSYDLPPTNMKGIVNLPGGFLAGFAGNEVCFSEPFLAYAWPIANRNVTEHDVVAIAATDSALVVATEGYPYLFSGVSPDAMTPRKLEMRLGCVSKRSMVDLGDQVIYACSKGLVAVSSQGVSLLTEESLDKRLWQQYKPNTIHAYVFDGYYFGFYGDSLGNGQGDGGFIYDVRANAFTRLNFYASAGYSDPLDDALYLMVNNKLVNFSQGSGQRLDYSWLSKVFVLGVYSLSCCFIDTDEPEKVGFILIADGVEVMNVAKGGLTDNRFRLPGVLADKWQFKLTGSAHIRRLILANSMAELY
ncbi:hypothetical protein J7384_17830 [Endozoicomonas sp. G2_1]|uniref:hypothetical protein n=1 Tax=Endozoicomonas sp. G2_1 TaxID=2821091 RepID=UPI001ADD3A20|nr:hypothetical protein [Endozoicomonas sp. G2_1]MBO9492226.1 hypothetical protein [Endozoicomonas sp. G2_1]